MHVSNATATNPSNNTNKSNQVYLSREQIEKLKQVLDRLVPICSSPGTSSSPTLHISPRAFLRQVLQKFRENHIDIEHVRLNGGAASFVLVDDRDFVYRDIDILFYIRTPLSSDKQTKLFSSNQQTYSCDVWTLIKYIVCSCLLEHIQNATAADEQKQQQQYTHHYLSTVLETYAKKIIKISSDQDSWALLSLQNPNGQNLEFKFVEHLKRQWQFSVDSFQINLEPLIHEKDTQSSNLCKCPSISSITQTIRTKSLVIDAINGLTIIKKQHDEQKEKSQSTVISTSPIQFGFFTPSSSPPPTTTAAAAAGVTTKNDPIGRENHIECQTLATITTIATSTSNQPNHQGRTRLAKNSHSKNHDEFNLIPLQFHLSLHDDTDDGIVSDADDSVTEDDDQVFRTPVDNNSAPASPATIIAIDVLTLPSAPVIEVHSAYPDLQQALDHLQKKLIATYAPETMRGGGLLKYCDLLAQNYKVHDVTDMLRMQRYMCSRFFIDYKTIPEQIHVINQYITTHFLPLAMNSNPIESTILSNNFRRSSSSHSNLMNKVPEQINLNNARLCLLFFDHLLSVIQHSTVCLTHHDKELTLLSINQLREAYHYQYEYLFVGDQYHYQRYHVHTHVNQHQHCSSSSSNSSRSSSPSSSSSNSYRYYRQPHHRQNHLHYRPNYHHNNQNHHHPQRQGSQNNSSATSSSSYHHHLHHNHHHHSSSRNYSNDLNSNVPSSLINHYHPRRHQS